MPRPYTPVRTSDFLGYVDDVAVEIGETEASTLQNLYKQRRKLVRRKGTAPLGGALSPDANLDGLAWYKIGSTEYLIAAHNGDLGDWFAGSPGATLTGGSAVFTGGNDVNSTWINQIAYFGNGVDQNVSFNGTRVDRAMVAPPATACTAAADGAGTGTGNYTFVYAFLAANGQLSETSPVSNQVTLAGQRADLTGVTVSSEPGVTARYIFATGGTRTDYVLVSILANNTATTVTVNLDGIISPFSPLQTGNTRFPPCRYLVENQSRMIGAWCATAEGDKSTVYISNQLQPWYSPAAPDLTISANGTRAQLQGPAAGEITGLCAHGDLTAVFTGGAGFLLIGTEAADFRLQRFSEHGCSAHRTIQSTRHLLVWLGNDGVWVWDGAQVSRISDPVRETIAAMSATDMAKAFSFVWYDRYFLCWPGHCLYFDLLNHTWGTNTNWDWRVGTVTVYTGSAQERIYLAQTGHARVWQAEVGSTDNGVAIPAAWRSRDWDMGMSAHEKRVHLIETKLKKSTGLVTVNLYRGAGDLIQTYTIDLSVVDYTSTTIVRSLVSAVETARDEHFALEILSSTTAADLQLLAAGLQWMLAR